MPDQDHNESLGQDSADRLAASFRDAARRYEAVLFDIEEGEPEPPGLDEHARGRLAEYHGGDGILPVAIGLIATQSVARLSSDLETLLNNAPGRLRTSDDAMAMLFALFLVGRTFAGGGVQIKAGSCRFGDHLQGLETLLIEPDVALGDFSVDFLLTYSELGPNPQHGGDPSEPAGKTEEHRVALLRDARDAGEYQDRMLRRTALTKSFGVTVVSYDDDEVRRDPFALAFRTIRDLSTRVHDALYGVT